MEVQLNKQQIRARLDNLRRRSTFSIVLFGSLSSTILRHLLIINGYCWLPITVGFLAYRYPIVVACALVLATFLSLARLNTIWKEKTEVTANSLMQRFIGLNRELYWPRDAHAQAKPLFDPWLFDDLHDWYDNYPHDTENVKDIAEYRSRCFKYKLKIESCLLTIATTVDPTILSGAHLKKRKTLDVIIKLLLKNALLNRDQESKIREVIGICNRGRHIENKIDPNDVKLLYQNGREALDLLYALSSQAVESMLDAAAKLPKDKR